MRSKRNATRCLWVPFHAFRCFRLGMGSVFAAGAMWMAAPTPATGAPLDIVINEVSWGGTAASSSDEWIELYNATDQDIPLAGWSLRTADGTPSVVLTGTVPARGYFLLERTDDAAVSDVMAEQFFSGSVANGPPAEDFRLVDAGSQTVDEVFFSTAGWPAGSGSPDFRSMERRDPSASGSVKSNWRSNNMKTRNGLDADGAPLNGTPKAPNSVFRAAERETCANGMDDDLNGFPDCEDGECAADVSCVARSESAALDRVLSVDGERNPFSPRAGGTDQRSTRFFFNVGDADVVKTLRLANGRGAFVRTLLNSDRGDDGSDWTGKANGIVFWDGRDDAGNLLPIGLYLALLEGGGPSGDSVQGRCAVAIAP